MMAMIREEVAILVGENEIQMHNKAEFKKIQELVRLLKLAKLITNDNKWDEKELCRYALNNLNNKTIYDLVKDKKKEKELKQKLTNIILEVQLIGGDNGK